jgi:hypothetical protein
MVRTGSTAQYAERGTGGRRVALEFVRFEPYVLLYLTNGFHFSMGILSTLRWFQS